MHQNKYLPRIHTSCLEVLLGSLSVYALNPLAPRSDKRGISLHIINNFMKSRWWEDRKISTRAWFDIRLKSCTKMLVPVWQTVQRNEIKKTLEWKSRGIVSYIRKKQKQNKTKQNKTKQKTTYETLLTL